MLLRLMTEVVWLGGGVAVAAPAPPPVRPADPNAPALVARGPGYFIHAVPLEVQPPRLWAFGLRNATAPVLLHTNTTTGEMKALLRAGTSSWLGPPMGIDRVHHARLCVAGIAADAQRVYVLVWKARAVTLRMGGPERAPDFRAGAYSLVVFRPSDGKQLHEVAFTVGKFPEGPSRDTTDKGPLKLHPAGVSAFGVSFDFAGDKFLRQRVDRDEPKR